MLSLAIRSARNRKGLFLALSLTVVAAVTLPANAKTPASSASAVPSLTYAKGRNGSGWLPFELEKGVRIMIPATVNGRKVKVMIDSGAGVTVLDRQFVASLGLEAVGDLTAEGGGGKGKYGVVKGVVIRLGDLTIKNSKTVGVDLQPIASAIGIPLPMVLGGAAFHKTVVDIDFKKHRIAFRDPAKFKRPQGMHAVALTPAAGGNRALEMQIEGRPARMTFDLGNAWPALLYPRFWNNPSFLKDRRVSSTLSGGWGGMHSEGMTRLRNVHLGGATFSAVPVPLGGMHSSDAQSGKLDGNVGMPLLSRFHLVIDFPHDQVLFGGPADTLTPFASNTTGLQLRSKDQGEEIRHVATGSPAEKAGLKVGDVISGLQDVGSGEEISLSSDWVHAATGREFRLVLSDGRKVVLRSAMFY